VAERSWSDLVSELLTRFMGGPTTVSVSNRVTVTNVFKHLDALFTGESDQLQLR